MKKILLITFVCLGIIMAYSVKAEVTYLTPVDINDAVSDNNWTDVDLSGSVPSGATGVILHFHNTSAGPFAMGARKNGSTDGTNLTLYQDNSHIWLSIGVDSNRVAEIIGWNVNGNVYLTGYYTDDAVFFTNAVDKTINTTSTWTDIDISSDTGSATAIAGIFIAITLNPEDAGFRKNGSTDNRVNLFDRVIGFSIGVDTSEICEAQVSDPFDVDLYLVGYVLSDSVFYTNAPFINASSTSAWLDTNIGAGGVATGAYIEVKATTGDHYGLRENGSAEAIIGRPSGDKITQGIIECDGDGKIEVYRSSANVTFYLNGITGISGTSGVATWLSYQVVASTDDGFEYEGSGGTFVTGGNLRAGYRDPAATYGNTHVGMRFLDVAIPVGATITRAVLRYTAQDTDASTDNVAVWGEDADDPVTFDTGANSPRDRVATTASVNWTLPNQVDGTIYDSPDISPIIQEIVDRGGWASGNDMVILIKNNGAIENHNMSQYDHVASEAPLLDISYVEEPAAATSSEVVTSTGHPIIFE